MATFSARNSLASGLGSDAHEIAISTSAVAVGFTVGVGLGVGVGTLYLTISAGEIAFGFAQALALCVAVMRSLEHSPRSLPVEPASVSLTRAKSTVVRARSRSATNRIPISFSLIEICASEPKPIPPTPNSSAAAKSLHESHVASRSFHWHEGRNTRTIIWRSFRLKK